MPFSVGDNVRPQALFANEGHPRGKVEDVVRYGTGQVLKLNGSWRNGGALNLAGYFELDPEKGKA